MNNHTVGLWDQDIIGSSDVVFMIQVRMVSPPVHIGCGEFSICALGSFHYSCERQLSNARWYLLLAPNERNHNRRPMRVSCQGKQPSRENGTRDSYLYFEYQHAFYTSAKRIPSGSLGPDRAAVGAGGAETGTAAGCGARAVCERLCVSIDSVGTG